MYRRDKIVNMLHAITSIAKNPLKRVERKAPMTHYSILGFSQEFGQN